MHWRGFHLVTNSVVEIVESRVTSAVVGKSYFYHQKDGSSSNRARLVEVD
jgi:hypothetical protein